MKHILITAFEPFGGESINPSLEVIKTLPASIPGALLHTLELPVSRYAATDLLLSVVAELQPQVVILLGEAGGNTEITPERVAINVEDYPIPDHAGHQPLDEPIIENGPAAYFSTLPIQEIVTNLRALGLPAQISNSAGTYLCNRTFYSLMHFLETTGASTSAGFVHVPYLPEQTVNKPPHTPSLPLADLSSGILELLRTTVA